MTFFDWIEDRTSSAKLVRTVMYEPIPGGARWRYVWGSVLVFMFALQVVTGLLLMTVYSPSATTAWGSVWYIQTQMPSGWLIRGLHHFGSHAMIILLPVHLLQVLVAKAYRAPREFNWWIGLGLLGVVLGLSLSGYLLPWDQKGYWATRVTTNILALVPCVGSAMQDVIVGGPAYGHGTLTRFFTLHVMVLPGLFVLLLAAHLALFRKHGVTVASKDASSSLTGYFWPEQLARDTVACAVVLAGVLAYAWYVCGLHGEALLAAPADPMSSDYPARPEWYFLFMFQLLKYFHGPGMEVVGAILVPGLVVAVLLAIPLLDRMFPSSRRKWAAHTLAVGFVCITLVGMAWLTRAALRDDRDPSEALMSVARAKQQRGDTLTEADHAVLRARQFNRQRTRARRTAERALALAAQHGIPPQGPLDLLANDPITRGPMLFAANCAACHRFNGHNGLGDVPSEPATSSDLGGFATRTWVRRLLENPMDDRYFGRMVKPDGEPAHTRMSRFIRRIVSGNESQADQRALFENFDAVAAYLAYEALHPGRLANISSDPGDNTAEQPAMSADASSEALIRKGRRFFMAVCNECHSYDGERSGMLNAPEMLGYGSAEWIELMIAEPSHETRYRSRGKEPAQMPRFEDRLSERDRRLIAEWLHVTRDAEPGSD